MKSIEDIRLENIRWLVRRGGNLTQAELARRMEVSPAQIQQWKRGDRTPGSESCRRIEQAAQLPPGWMDQNHSHMSPGDLSASLIKPPPGMEWAAGWGAGEENAQARGLSGGEPLAPRGGTGQNPVSALFSATPNVWVQAPPAARALAEIILKKSSDEELSDDDIQFLLGAVTRISKEKK